MKAKLLIATGNTGKLRELCQLLDGIPYDIISPAEAGVECNTPEVGKTYMENAIIKASAHAKKSNLLTLADDSGLEVDALGGEPGIRSARFGRAGLSDSERNKLLLKSLEGVPEQERTARFICTIAIVSPEGRIEICNGVCEGIIATESKGIKNFGYDPVFYLPQLDKTMAEVTPEVKNQISHRAKAAKIARAKLISWSTGIK